MGALALLWGVSFFFSKVALAELPPLTLALLLGSLILAEPVAATALAGIALIFAGLLAIDGRLLRARRAAVAPPRSRSKAA